MINMLCNQGEPHPPRRSNPISSLGWKNFQSATGACDRLLTGGENPRVQLVSSWSNIGDQVRRIFTLRYRWTDHGGQVRWGGTPTGSHWDSRVADEKGACLTHVPNQWSITLLQLASFDCSLYIHLLSLRLCRNEKCSRDGRVFSKPSWKGDRAK